MPERRKWFGLHVWKSMRRVREWKRVAEGASVLIERDETPEEYHMRKNDMVTVLFFGRLFTFKIPGRGREGREETGEGPRAGKVGSPSPPPEAQEG